MTRLILLPLALAIAAGCEPTTTVPPAGTTKTTDAQKPTDVHVNTPRLNVDVKGKDGDRKVDVTRKDR